MEPAHRQRLYCRHHIDVHPQLTRSALRAFSSLCRIHTQTVGDAEGVYRGKLLVVVNIANSQFATGFYVYAEDNCGTQHF